MKPEDQILEAAVAAFFPEQQLPSSIHNKIQSLIKSGKLGASFIGEAQLAILNAGYMPTPSIHHTTLDLASEVRLRLFYDTVTALRSNFPYWLQGMDNDVLPEFPAQKLIRVFEDPREVINWEQHWRACDGKTFDGEMIALKWDAVWMKISFLNLPFPPFQLGSGYEIEDVDRDEAEALGFQIPKKFTTTVKIAFDVGDLKEQFSKALSVLR